MNIINMKTLLVFCMLVSAPTFSAAKMKNADGETSTDPWSDFISGESRLTCSWGCAFKDGGLKVKMKRAYKQERWEDLVKLVFKSSFLINRNYFYLAIAAENLGHLESALIYYRLAKNEIVRCSTALIGGTCYGIKVRVESEERIALLKDRLAASEAYGTDIVGENGQSKEQQSSTIDASDDQVIDSTPAVSPIKSKPAVLAFNGKGKWDESIKTDPITDEKIVTATIKSNDFQTSYNSKTAMLIRCDNRKIDIFVAFDDYLGNKSIRVTSRVDKDKPEINSWDLSTNNQAAFYPRGDKDLLKRLFSAEQFVVRATPYNESTKTLIFDVKGIYNVLEPHQQTCGW